MNYLKFAPLLLCLLIALNTSAQDVNHFQRALDFQDINSDSAMKYGNLAYLEARHIQDVNLRIDVLVLLIKTGIKQGKFSSALRQCLAADSMAAANRLLNRQIEILMYKGLVLLNSGLHAEGLELLIEAKEQMNDNNFRTFESELDYYIGLAYYYMGDMILCRNYLMEAYHEEISTENPSNAFKSLMLMSSTFQHADSVSRYLQLASRSLENDSSNYKQVILLNNLALLYRSTGRSTLAKGTYLKALAISSEAGFYDITANLYNNFAYLLMAEDNFDSAFRVLDEALEISRNLDNIDLEASVLDSYSDCYVAVGDSSRALRTYRKSVKLKNQSREARQIERSQLLSVVFETGKKEQEIVRQNNQLQRVYLYLALVLLLLLVATFLFLFFRQLSSVRKVRLTNLDQEKKLEVAHAMIKGQDSERKRLAMNLHDGIAPKVGALKLLVDHFFNNRDGYEKVSGSIADIDVNIREMSHRMLPSQLESRGLVVALEQFIHSLQQDHNLPIRFYTTLNHRLDEQYESHLFFIVYELLNNAIKHAHAKEITVQLLEDEDMISCSVEDDGAGFDPDLDFEGIGLKNIYQRVNYLDGEISIDSVPGQGTAILIEIHKRK